MFKNPFCLIHVIPTSLCANFGGFAGDATPATNLLASISDYVIAHPNIVNASDLNEVFENVLYVEGYFIDQFCIGKIALRRIRSNKIGVVIDNVDQKFVNNVINMLNAVTCVNGINIIGYTIPKKKIAPRIRKNQAGYYVGIVDNLDDLIESAQKLIKAGAEAIAITLDILDAPNLKLFLQGLEPCPYGGIEAIISHTVGSIYQVPCAHAPLCTWTDFTSNGIVDPREGAEEVTITAIASVLQGLQKAPKLIDYKEKRENDLSIEDISALVCPYNSLGGVPMLACAEKNIKIIAVRENATIAKIDNSLLNLPNVIQVENYLEAIGVLLCLKKGITLRSVRRPVKTVERI